ncbi:MAG: hypothetical protein ACJ8C4_19120 [Gemmataceae bacterium]
MRAVNWTSGLVVSGLLCVAVVAQTPAGKDDLIDRTKQISAVASQKGEADARLALREAAHVEKSNPAAALATLKAGLAAIETDAALPAVQKAKLQRIFHDQIRIIEGGPESPEQIAARQKAEEARQAAVKAETDKRIAEETKVKQGLEQVVKLRKEGKTAEADKAVTDLAKNHPQSLAVQLLTGKQTTEKALAADQQVRKDTSKATVTVMRDVDNSGVPITGDIQFPKDWQERTKNRRDAAAPTPEERQLIAVLDRPIDVRYKNSRFQDVMDHLSETLGRTIIVDGTALPEAGVNYDTPITFSVREPVATRATLRSILSPLNLTFVIRDNVIHITTPSRAKDLMITKVYYLGDLMTGLGPMGGAPTIGFNMDQIQAVQNVTAIVEMIRNAIDPMSWENKGGQGSIGVTMQTMSIVVRQSQEVHAMLRGSLYGPPKAPPAQK